MLLSRAVPRTSDASTRYLRNHVIFHIKKIIFAPRGNRSHTITPCFYARERPDLPDGKCLSRVSDSTGQRPRHVIPPFSSRSAQIKFSTSHSTDGDIGASAEFFEYCTCGFTQMLR